MPVIIKTCNITHTNTCTHMYVHTHLHTNIAPPVCGSRNLPWQYQMWQCSMWDNVPLHGCTVPQSHSEIVILLVVAHTCWVPRTDPVPLMGALVHFVHSYVCCTCFLCFPLVQRHYPLSCTVQSVSVFHMWWRVEISFALVLLYMLLQSLYQLSPFKRVVYMCSLFLLKGNVMTANLPSVWPGLLPVGLWGGPSRDCPWTAHKGQSWPECGGWCEELTSSLSLCPLCHSLCPTLAGWSWCCTPGMWRWSRPTCGDTGGGIWDVTRHQRQCEHFDSAWAQTSDGPVLEEFEEEFFNWPDSQRFTHLFSYAPWWTLCVLLSCPTTQLANLHNVMCHCVPHVVLCENTVNCVTCISVLRCMCVIPCVV